jgi:hypothetical protein
MLSNSSLWRFANAATASALLEIAFRALARYDTSAALLNILRAEIQALIAGQSRLDELPQKLTQRLSA